MRLIDILLGELSEWPEDCDEIFQTSSGRIVGISNSDRDFTEKLGNATLNDEDTDPHVTRSEFISARRKILDRLKPENVDPPFDATHTFSFRSSAYHAKRNSSYGWSLWQNSEWVFIGSAEEGEVDENSHGKARELFGEELFNYLNPECKWYKHSESLKEKYRSAYDSGYRKVKS